MVEQIRPQTNKPNKKVKQRVSVGKSSKRCLEKSRFKSYPCIPIKVMQGGRHDHQF